jgi:hypothetical protein
LLFLYRDCGYDDLLACRNNRLVGRPTHKHTTGGGGGGKKSHPQKKKCWKWGKKKIKKKNGKKKFWDMIRNGKFNLDLGDMGGEVWERGGK